MKPLLAWCLLLQACASSAPVAQRATLRGILARDLRIDGYAADLSRVSGIAVAPDGTILVGQPEDGTILSYAPDGRRLGRFGRPGAGPGEFRRLTTLGWVGDTLWAVDMDLLRLTLIFPARQLLRTIRLPTSIIPPRPATGPVPKLESPWLGVPLPGGDLLVQADIRGGKQPPPYDAELQDKDGVYARVSADGAYRHLLLAYSVFGEQCKWGPTLFIPQCPRPQRDFADDRSTVVTAETSVTGTKDNSYCVTLMRINGDTVFSRRYPFAGVPITKRVVDSIRARLLSQATSTEKRSAIRTVPFPPVYPPIKNVRVGRDGTTWIGLRETAAGRPWIVLDSVGTPIGELVLPHGVVLWVADRKTIWAVEWDADDMNSIVRYQITWRR
jgi:hypothetical protein